MPACLPACAERSVSLRGWGLHMVEGIHDGKMLACLLSLKIACMLARECDICLLPKELNQVLPVEV